MADKKKWIAGAIKKPGALRKGSHTPHSALYGQAGLDAFLGENGHYTH